MVPVFLLGSAVYLVRVPCLFVIPLRHRYPQGLELTQLNLSHEKYMSEATRRIEALESEIAALQEKRTRDQQQSNVNVNSPSRRWWW